MSVCESDEDRYQKQLEQILKVEAEENSDPKNSYDAWKRKTAYDNIRFENLQLKVQCENTVKELQKKYEGKISYLKNNSEKLRQRNLDLLGEKDKLSAEYQKFQKEFNNYQEQATNEINEYKRQINELNKKLNFEKLNTAQKANKRVHIRVPVDGYKEINRYIKQSGIKTLSNAFNMAIYEGIEEGNYDNISDAKFDEYFDQYYSDSNKMKEINCNLDKSLYGKVKQITHGKEMSLNIFILMKLYMDNHKLSD